MSVLPVCMKGHHGLQYLWRPEEDVRTGVGVMGGCDLPCGYWEQNLGPLQESSKYSNC